MIRGYDYNIWGMLLEKALKIPVAWLLHIA